MPVIKKYRAIADSDIPAVIARDAEFQAADAAHIGALDPHSQYLLRNPTGIEFGLAAFNTIDFHVTPSPATMDFDVRLAASSGRSQNGQGDFSLQAALFTLLGKVAIGLGNAQLSRLLMVGTLIDLPSIASGGIHDIYMSCPGARVGDIAFFVPTVELYNGLWTFQIQAAITANDVARVYFRNAYHTAVDIAAFSGKLLVIGF